MALQHGNSKLGKIWQWSIPAIDSCPGSSQLCRNECYACKGFYNYPSVEDSLQANFRLAKSMAFVPTISRFIAKRSPDTVRIHVSGDFYSEGYLKKWSRVVRNNPGTLFYAYTRSWRSRSGDTSPWLGRLLEFASEPNVRLWFSCDSETGAPPRSRKVRRAYMATSDYDSPSFLVDLVFRTNTGTELKRDPRTSVLVCPVEQGLSGSHDLQCSSCRLCFDDSRQASLGKPRSPRLHQLSA